MELTKLQLCENAFRDMFHDEQYHGRVPNKDIQYILKSDRWARMYGKANVHKAWNGLVKEKYVLKQRNFWIWAWGVQDG